MYLPSKGFLVFVGCLTGIAVYRAQRPGAMTPERDKLYRKCLSGQVRDSSELRRIADQFQGWRLFPQAELLRQRAALRELPTDVKLARRATFRKGMASKNKAAVLKLADAFDGQGCTTAAHRLRLYGSGLPDLDSHSFESAAIVTPPAPDEPGTEGETGSEGPETAERSRDTEPAPSNERPLQTPLPPETRPETPPGPNPDLGKGLNGASAHAA